jgi:hypothetical protein
MMYQRDIAAETRTMLAERKTAPQPQPKSLSEAIDALISTLKKVQKLLAAVVPDIPRDVSDGPHSTRPSPVYGDEPGELALELLADELKAFTARLRQGR